MKASIKIKAQALSDSGNSSALYALIKPDIEKGDPYALHFFATFSLPEESTEDFEKRSIALRIKASEGGVAQASYRMGVNHLYGDDVEQSYEKASQYFERAITQGHSYTKFTYGFSLYYGMDENTQDEARGLRLMTEAAAEGIDKAQRELDLINA